MPDDPLLFGLWIAGAFLLGLVAGALVASRWWLKTIDQILPLLKKGGSLLKGQKLGMWDIVGMAAGKALDAIDFKKMLPPGMK